MNCKKCKKEISVDAIYCPYCGQKQSEEKKVKRRGNGQGYVYKRGNKYVAQVTLGYKNLKRVTASKTFEKKSDAINALSTLKNTKFEPVNTDIKFSDAFEKAMEHQKKKASESTIHGYRYAFKHFDNISYRRLADIKTTHLQKCVDEVPGTRMKQMMKTAAGLTYKWAIQNDVIDKNYAEFIIFKAKKAEEKEIFTADEIKKITNAAGKVPYAEYILALILTGFRPSELLNLKKSDYHETYFIGGSKTEAGRNRLVPIHPILRPHIERLIQSDSEYIFSAKNGAKMDLRNFRKREYKEALEQIGVRPLSPYSCRHTFATLIKDVDGANADKSRLMGHTKYSMTAHYTHADEESLASIINGIIL